MIPSFASGASLLRAKRTGGGEPKPLNAIAGWLTGIGIGSEEDNDRKLQNMQDRWKTFKRNGPTVTKATIFDDTITLTSNLKP